MNFEVLDDLFEKDPFGNYYKIDDRTVLIVDAECLYLISVKDYSLLAELKLKGNELSTKFFFGGERYKPLIEEIHSYLKNV